MGEQIKVIHKLDDIIGVNGASMINDFKNHQTANMQTMINDIIHQKELGSMSIPCIRFD